MACGCAERGEAIVKAAIAIADGNASEAAAQAKFVVKSAAQDIGGAVRAAGTRLGFGGGR